MRRMEITLIILLFIPLQMQMIPGLIQQVHTEKDTLDCLAAYCTIAGRDSNNQCMYKDQIRTILFAHHDSRGPGYAHHIGEQLMGDEEFCMQIDSHR